MTIPNDMMVIWRYNSDARNLRSDEVVAQGWFADNGGYTVAVVSTDFPVGSGGRLPEGWRRTERPSDVAFAIRLLAAEEKPTAPALTNKGMLADAPSRVREVVADALSHFHLHCRKMENVPNIPDDTKGSYRDKLKDVTEACSLLFGIPTGPVPTSARPILNVSHGAELRSDTGEINYGVLGMTPNGTLLLRLRRGSDVAVGSLEDGTMILRVVPPKS